MATRDVGLVGAIRVDLQRLYDAWVGLLFARHPVTGRETPDSAVGMVGFRLWQVLGALAVGLSYPLAVVGFATRYYARKLNRAAVRLGLAGVVLLTALVWGGLTAYAVVSQFSQQGVLAVAAASVVAVVSSALSMVFYRVDGRPVTVAAAYPFAVTALTLPPVVAAFYSPTLADLVFPSSQSLAVWLIDRTGPIGEWFEEQFELQGIAYVALWFGLSTPVGWLLGGTVSLANVVRPTYESEAEEADGEQ